MGTHLTESTVEEAALEIFEGLGYATLHGPNIAPGELFAERKTYSDILLLQRLKAALARVNPKIPPGAIEDAVRKLLSITAPTLPSFTLQHFTFRYYPDIFSPQPSEHLRHGASKLSN